jgi:hypothetical protein
MAVSQWVYCPSDPAAEKIFSPVSGHSIGYFGVRPKTAANRAV